MMDRSWISALTDQCFIMFHYQYVLYCSVFYAQISMRKMFKNYSENKNTKEKRKKTCKGNCSFVGGFKGAVWFSSAGE